MRDLLLNHADISQRDKTKNIPIAVNGGSKTDV